MFHYNYHILSNDTFTINGTINGNSVTKHISAVDFSRYMGMDVMKIHRLLVNHPYRVMDLDYFKNYSITEMSGQLISEQC